MQAYVSLGKWRWGDLTCVGRVVACYTCGSGDHTGIVFTCAPPDVVARHSAPEVSEESGRGENTVGFDSTSSGYPLFQGLDTYRYWGSTVRSDLFPILDVDAAKVHAACMYLAKARPFNDHCFRTNPLCGGCWPCAPGSSRTPLVGPSTCVGLVVRAIAFAKSDDLGVFTDDRRAVEVLGVDMGCKRRLVSLQPAEMVRKLREAGVVAPSVGWVDDLDACATAPTLVPTASIPLLSLQILRS